MGKIHLLLSLLSYRDCTVHVGLKYFYLPFIHPGN